MVRSLLSRHLSAISGLLLLFLLPYLLFRLSLYGLCRPPQLPSDPDLSHEGLVRAVVSSFHRLNASGCRHPLRSGGWEICASHALFSYHACHVFSVMTARASGALEYDASDLLGCQVTVVTPAGVRSTSGRAVLQPPQLSDEGWLSDTLWSLGDPIAVLVLDVGPSAWGALERALRTGAIARVRQLAVVLETEASSRADLLRYLRVLRGLEVNFGFRKWRRRSTGVSSECAPLGGCEHRVTFLNDRLAAPC